MRDEDVRRAVIYLVAKIHVASSESTPVLRLMKGAVKPIWNASRCYIGCARVLAQLVP